MYIAPSTGYEWLKLNLPFELTLRRFEVVFCRLECECCTFSKIDGNSFKSTNTNYTMALILCKHKFGNTREINHIHISHFQ